jgi:hypothetical protein
MNRLVSFGADVEPIAFDSVAISHAAKLKSQATQHKSPKLGSTL